MHCSKMLKNFNYSTTIVVCFLVLVVLKITLWLFNTTNNNALMQLLLKPNENMEKKKIQKHQLGPKFEAHCQKNTEFQWFFPDLFLSHRRGCFSAHHSVEVDNFREKNQRIVCFLAPRICYCYVTLSVAHVVEWQPLILRRHTWSCAFGKVMKWVCKY